jgi:hypothetical protein
MSEEQTLKRRTSQDRLETNLNSLKDYPIRGSSSVNSLGRREFIGNIGAMTTAALTASVIGLSSISEDIIPEAEAAEIGPLNPNQRRRQAFRVRLQAAEFQKKIPLPEHPCNGDEALYPNKIGRLY